MCWSKVIHLSGDNRAQKSSGVRSHDNKSPSYIKGGGAVFIRQCLDYVRKCLFHQLKVWFATVRLGISNEETNILPGIRGGTSACKTDMT